MKKVLLVIEDTEQAARAVEYISERLLTPQLEVILLAVKRRPKRWPAFNATPVDDTQADMRIKMALNVAWRRLDELGAQYTSHISAGEFAPAVLGIARSEKCDLIVMPRGSEDEATGVARRWTFAAERQRVTAQREIPVAVFPVDRSVSTINVD